MARNITRPPRRDPPPDTFGAMSTNSGRHPQNAGHPAVALESGGARNTDGPLCIRRVCNRKKKN